MADETILRSHGLRTNVGKLIRVDTLEGREHLVAPVVLITEGVHNNVYYSADELSKHTDAWNGRPLVAPSHPTVNGRPVTANSKKVLEKMQVGTVLNVHWNAGTKKLMGEAWFDKEKTQAKCPKVLAELEKEAPQVEVSTGLYTDDTFKANTFGAKQYACEAKNHRPDHLAVLLNEKGACSWEDGAGLPRINAAMDDDDLDEPTVNTGTSDGARKGWETRRGGGETNEDAIDRGVNAALRAREERIAALPKPTTSEAAAKYVQREKAEAHYRAVIKDPKASREEYNAAWKAWNELDDWWHTAAAGMTLPELNAVIMSLPRRNIKNNVFEGGHISDEDDTDPETCPDCGGELVDGVCPECDGEAYVEEPEKKPAKQNSIMHVLSAIAEKLGITVNRKVDISAGEKASRVSKALSARYNPETSGSWGPSNTPCTPSPWLRDLFDGYAVYEMYGKTFKLSLSWDNGQPVFEGEPVEVVQNTEWVPKNNSDDKWLETEGTWEVPGWEAAK